MNLVPSFFYFLFALQRQYNGESALKLTTAQLITGCFSRLSGNWMNSCLMQMRVASRADA